MHRADRHTPSQKVNVASALLPESYATHVRPPPDQYQTRPRPTPCQVRKYTVHLPRFGLGECARPGWAPILLLRCGLDQPRTSPSVPIREISVCQGLPPYQRWAAASPFFLLPSSFIGPPPASAGPHNPNEYILGHFATSGASDLTARESATSCPRFSSGTRWQRAKSGLPFGGFRGKVCL